MISFGIQANSRSKCGRQISVIYFLWWKIAFEKQLQKKIWVWGSKHTTFKLQFRRDINHCVLCMRMKMNTEQILCLPVKTIGKWNNRRDDSYLALSMEPMMTESLFRMNVLEEPLLGTLMGVGEVGCSNDCNKSPKTSAIEIFSKPSSTRTGQLGLGWKVMWLVGIKNPEKQREEYD